MRYLRPHRRKIEMFIEVLRAWFEVEERWEVVRALQLGAPGVAAKMARDTATEVEYFAASLIGTEYGRDASQVAVRGWLGAGEVHEAALALADFSEVEGVAHTV